MNRYPFPILFSILVLSAFATASTPWTADFGATAPDASGGHFAVSAYFNDNVFVQARLEEGFTRYDTKLISLQHGLVGVGYEHEFSSKTFFRLTAGAGGGYVYDPSNAFPGMSEWLYTARIAPEIDWFPAGRFRRPSIGINAGINFQTRFSTDSRPVLGGLSGRNAQLFLGLVL